MKNSETLKLSPRDEREIVVTRLFDAPRKLVYEAFTKPEHVKRWLLGPPGWTMTVCDMDMRAGGAYRWLWRNDSDGTEMGMRGLFREVVRPERVVHTEKCDRIWYPGEAVITTAFADRGGKTELTLTILYGSGEARDIVVKSGMQNGMAASYDRLEELLASAGELYNTQRSA